MPPPYLTALYSENFTNQSIQDPLNSANWNQSLDSGFFGTLQVAADGSGGANVCDCDVASFSSQGSAQQFWIGTAPANCYVKFTIANSFPPDQVSAVASYRSNANNANTTGYYCRVTLGDTSVWTVIVTKGRRGATPLLSKTLTGGVNPGDTFVFAVVGLTHYVLQNGVQVGTFTDSTYVNGGAGTISLGAICIVANTDVQFNYFETGTASNTAPSSPSKSNWISLPRDFINKHGLK